MLGGGVSHPSQLTTGLVIKSVTTSPTLAGERMLFILQVSILSEQSVIFSRAYSALAIVLNSTSSFFKKMLSKTYTNISNSSKWNKATYPISNYK